MIRIAAATLVAAVLASPAFAQTAPDGEKLFNQRCRVCHQAATTPMGPALKGVAGRKMASDATFKYSTALTAKGGAWTDANLDTWLSGPAKFVPGTRMMVSVPQPADRAAIIAHIKTLK